MKKGFIASLHAHPISAHFPSAFFPFSAVFLILLMIKGGSAFELGVKYALWCGVLTNPVALASGFYDWKTRYKAARVPIFKKKIKYSIAAQTLAIVCAVWLWFEPDVLTASSYLPYIFLALLITSTVFTFLVGRWGARLVYL